jgi:hypothetical protein
MVERMVTLKPSPLLLLLLLMSCVVITRLNLSHFFACRMIFICNRKQVTINNAYVHGQKVIGRANQRLGKLLVGSPEDLRFRSSFGVSAEVAVEAWVMMADHNFLPPNPKFLHYLWALAFM